VGRGKIRGLLKNEPNPVIGGVTFLRWLVAGRNSKVCLIHRPDLRTGSALQKACCFQNDRWRGGANVSDQNSLEEGETLYLRGNISDKDD